MGFGMRGLTAWTTIVVLAASLSPLAQAQTSAPTQPDSTTAAKPEPAKTPTATKAAASKPKPSTTAAGQPAATGTKSATTKSSTTTRAKTPAAKPAQGTSGTAAKSAAAKPGTAPQITTPKATTPARAKPAAPAATTTAAQAKPAAVAPPAPTPSGPITPPTASPQATPLRDTTATASALPGAPAPAAAPGLSFRQRHPLVGGFLTGLLGAGLAHTLLGPDAPDAAPDQGQAAGNVLEPVTAGLTTAEVAGQLLRLAFFGGLVALAVMFYRRRAGNGATPTAVRERNAPGLSAWDDLDPSLPAAESSSLAHPDDLKAIADEQDFADILRVVQAAWSEGDVMAMRGHITPDMATYFDRRLAQNIDNGIENRVVDVSDIRVERLSDWEEDGVHYAKARMSWRALDYVIDMSKLPDEPGYIIDGSLEKPIDCEEVWTFASSPDGAWVLCEVEQGD